jgi:hypothetical protein
MRSLNLLAVAAIAATCALAPASVRSQEQPAVKSDVLIRVEGPMKVGPTDSIGTLVIIGNNVDVLGTVRELIVINGSARIEGTVLNNMTVLNGSADLGSSARIGKDVLLYRSTLNSATGSRIGGTVHNEMGVSLGARALWLLWLSVTIAMIAGGLALGYFAKDSLGRVADGLRSEWRGTVVTALVLLFGLPAAAVLSFITGIGFVLGFFIMFVMIPFLSLVGYVIVATSIGRALLGAERDDASRMFTAIALGILILQLVLVVPGIGGVAVLVSSQLGAGALVYRTRTKNRSVPVPHGLIIQPA